jgi:hypothetical protein
MDRAITSDGEIGLEAAVRNPAQVYARGVDKCRSR